MCVLRVFELFAMEACIAVEKEVDKVVSKLESFEKHQARTLQDLIDTVTSMEQEIGAGACGDKRVSPMDSSFIWTRNSSVFRLISLITQLGDKFHTVHIVLDRIA